MALAVASTGLNPRELRTYSLQLFAGSGFEVKKVVTPFINNNKKTRNLLRFCPWLLLVLNLLT